MGGHLGIRVRSPTRTGRTETAARCRSARPRIDAWAGRLTRFSPTRRAVTAQCHLRTDRPVASDPRRGSGLGSRCRGSDGWVVDVTLLDARLAAEAGTEPDGHGLPLSTHDAVRGTVRTLVDRARGAELRAAARARRPVRPGRRRQRLDRRPCPRAAGAMAGGDRRRGWRRGGRREPRLRVADRDRESARSARRAAGDASDRGDGHLARDRWGRDVGDHRPPLGSRIRSRRGIT